MIKSPEERFNEAMANPTWASWFEHQSKKDLWILMVEKTENIEKFHEEKHESQSTLNWYSALLKENKTMNRLVFWFIMGFISAIVLTNL